jgi:hypothetical protein
MFGTVVLDEAFSNSSRVVARRIINATHRSHALGDSRSSGRAAGDFDFCLRGTVSAGGGGVVGDCCDSVLAVALRAVRCIVPTPTLGTAGSVSGASSSGAYSSMGAWASGPLALADLCRVLAGHPSSMLG